MASFLIIDDSPDFQIAMREAFEARGHHVLQAFDGLAGLQRAVEDDPDVIMVAGGGAGLGGLTLCGDLSCAPETKHRLLVMCADLMTPTDVLAATAVGVRQVLSRATEHAVLARQMESILETHQHQARLPMRPATNEADTMITAPTIVSRAG